MTKTESGPLESAAPAGRSNLANRLLASAVLIPLLWALFYADHKFFGPSAPVLLLLCEVLGLRAAWEMCQLLRTRSFRVHRPAVLLTTGLVIASSWWVPMTAETIETLPCGTALGPVAVTFALCVMGLLLFAAARYHSPGDNMETVGAEILITAYVGLLIAVTAQLRWVAGFVAGYLVIGSMILPAKMGDIGAYTFGRLFGKRKLAPRLSPGKTWAGAVGALVFSAATGWMWLQWATPMFRETWEPPAWWLSLLFGAAMGLTGLLGDLCESLIKRDVGQKDAAPLLPGFGGTLDLIDSPLFAGPTAYLLWTLLPLATWQ